MAGWTPVLGPQAPAAATAPAGTPEGWTRVADAEQPGPFERFFTQLVNHANPLPALKAWAEHGPEVGKAMDALRVTREAAMRNPDNKGKPPAQWKYDLTPEEQAVVDRGMQANIGNPQMLQHTMPMGTENLPEAGLQASRGDLAGAAGTALAQPAAAAATLGLVKGVPAAARGMVAAASNPVVQDVIGIASPRAAHGLALVRRGASAVERIKAAVGSGEEVTPPQGLTESWARSQGSDVVPRTPQFDETPPAQPIQMQLPKGGAPIRVTEADPRTRTLPDGRKQVLKEVPIDQIQGDPGNKIFEPTVAKYQKEGYTQPAELRPNPDGGYTIWEGHHRILADVRNGAESVKAWVPDEGGPMKPAPPVSNAPLKPEAATASKTGIANVEDEARTLAKTLHGAGIASADVPAIKPADWREISRVLGISEPGMDHVARVNFYMKKFENAAPAAKAFANAVQ